MRNNQSSLPSLLGPKQELVTPSAILRVVPFREHDLMAHLLTPTYGKISVVARHARGSRRRFPAALDLFDRGSATLGAEKSGILSLKSFTPVHSLMTLRRDLDKLSLASVIAESFDLTVPEGDTTGAEEIFQLFDLALNAVNEAPDLRSALKSTAIACLRLGALAGFLPSEEIAPSAHSLKNALIATERFAQRKLLTKPTAFEVIERFSRNFIATGSKSPGTPTGSDTD